jgi:hypothetical protein
MKVCGIERNEDGSLARGDDGKVKVDTDNREGSFSLETEPINSMIEMQSWWDSRGKAAQAAAQLDSKWQVLAGATIEAGGLMVLWINMRKEGLNPYSASSSDQDVARYIAKKSEVATICGGLALQLESE